MATIKKDTLHPENEPEVDIYPKTSIDQVENLQANLDALNGDIANISANVETIANRVEIAENSITVLNTAYESYTDYTEVTNGFLLTYLSGKQIELPIKAGTNVTFSKYPGTNQIVINATGGSVPDNIALLDADNDFTGNNQFVNIRSLGILEFYGEDKQYRFSKTTSGFKFFIISGDNSNSLLFPNRTGTLALVEDLPKLADYPTTIFFNNYNAGIGYKDTSTGTTKTVVSTDNNGAQIVIGDSNTGLTLATNARPKVLEDSTVKEVAYVSDIPNTSSFPTLAGNNNWTGINIFDGFAGLLRVNGSIQVSMDQKPISTNYNQVSYNGYRVVYMDGENQNMFYAGIDYENKARFGFDKYDGSSYTLYIPEKDGTIALLSDIPNTSTPQYNRGIDSATPTTFTYELGVYHTLTITLLTTYVSTTIIFPDDYDGSRIDIELEGKSFLIMVVAGLLSVRNTTDNTEWVGKLE